jgi:hypothetical protein
VPSRPENIPSGKPTDSLGMRVASQVQTGIQEGYRDQVAYGMPTRRLLTVGIVVA